MSLICYLCYGNDDYEDSKEYKAYFHEMNAWWHDGQVGPRPIHWRKRVRDNWAGIYIFEDPEHQPNHESGYARRLLYDPSLLQDTILETPRVIRVIQAAIEQDASSLVMRQVHKELSSFFRNEFHHEWKEWLERQVSSGKNMDSITWIRVLKFLENGIELISASLLLNYELNPIEWAVRVLNHGEPSEEWLAHLARVNAQTNPSPLQIERIMGSSATVSSNCLVLEEEIAANLTIEND